jgi:hypothetical protein
VKRQRRRPRIHQSMRTKRRARRWREDPEGERYWRRLVRAARKARLSGIDPTRTAPWTVEMLTYHAKTELAAPT